MISNLEKETGTAKCFCRELCLESFPDSEKCSSCHYFYEKQVMPIPSSIKGRKKAYMYAMLCFSFNTNLIAPDCVTNTVTGGHFVFYDRSLREWYFICWSQKNAV